MKLTLREQLLKKFRSNYLAGKQGFVNSQTIQDVMHDITGKKHDTISRELRRLAENGEIISKIIKNEKTNVSSVWYMYKPSRVEQLSNSMKGIWKTKMQNLLLNFVGQKLHQKNERR